MHLGALRTVSANSDASAHVREDGGNSYGDHSTEQVRAGGARVTIEQQPNKTDHDRRKHEQHCGLSGSTGQQPSSGEGSADNGHETEGIG